MTAPSDTLTATLDRLVRKGVITSFEMPPGSNAILLHVIVAAPVVTNPHNPSYDRETVERFRRRVTREVEPYRAGRDVMVSVPGRLMSPFAPRCVPRRPQSAVILSGGE